MKTKAIFYIISLFAMLSCVKDSVVEYVPSYNEDGSEIVLTLDMPNFKQVNTRAIEAPDENYIRLLDVLVFGDDDKFLYRSIATEVTNSSSAVNGNQKEFKVKLKKTEGSNLVKLMFIANARYEIGDIAVGETRTDVAQRIEFSIPENNKWTSESAMKFDPFPMWGETGLMQIDGSPLSGIKMLRALAKIDIGVNMVGEDATSLPNFIFKGAYLVNHNTKGRVAPDAANFNSTDNKVEQPTAVLSPSTGAVFYAVDKPSNPSIINTIYIPESDAAQSGNENDATYIVIQGQWNYNYIDFSNDVSSDPIYYYKIDLMTEISNTLTYIPILRNHRYRINIKSVSCPGYLSFEEACNNPAFNNNQDFGVTLDIEDISSDYLKDIVTDGTYYLSVSRHFKGNSIIVNDLYAMYNQRVDITASGAELLIDEIQTNHPSGWTAQISDTVLYVGTETDPVTGDLKYIEEWRSADTPTWLTEVEWSGAQNVKAPIKGRIMKNETSDARVVSLVISAGRMSYKIGVIQYSGIEGLGDYIDFPVNFENSDNPSPFRLKVYPHIEDDEYYGWSTYANTDENHLSAMSPPAGRQHYPPVEKSCAAQTTEGYYNWRLPTIEEVLAISKYEVGNRNFFDCYITDLVSASSSPLDSTYFFKRRVLGGVIEDVPMSKIPQPITDYNSHAIFRGISSRDIRCVRTLDEKLFVKTGTRMELPSGVSTSQIILYTNSGFKWKKGNAADYDQMISNTQATKLQNVENGYEKWQITLTTNDNTALQHRNTYLIVSAADDSSPVAIELEHEGKYGHMIPTYHTGLGYDILLSEKPINFYKTWYEYANVNDGYNSFDEPPMGTVSSTPRANSCEGFDGGGLNNWRLPTAVETKKMMSYIATQSTLDNFGLLQNPSGTSYMYGAISLVTSSTFEHDNTYALAASYTIHSNGLVPVDNIHLNDVFLPYLKSDPISFGAARCIRVNNDNFYVAPGLIEADIKAKTYKIRAYSKFGLSPTVAQDANYSAMINNVSMTSAGTKNGWTMWDIEISVKEAGADDRQTVIGFQSSTGGYSQNVTVTQYGYGYVIEVENEDHEIMFTGNDNGRWYESSISSNLWNNLANVPDGVVNKNTPPLGPQITNQSGTNGSHPSSCANLTYGGYDDWRLPTLNEMTSIHRYLITNNKTNQHLLYGIGANDYISGQQARYITADRGMEERNFDKAQYVYFNYRTSSEPSVVRNEITKIFTTLGGDYAVRCVRDVNEFFDLQEKTIYVNGFPSEEKLRVITSGTLTGYSAGDNFATVVDNVAIAHKGLNPDGKNIYEVTVKTKFAGHGSKVNAEIILNSSNGKQKILNVMQEDLFTLKTAASLGYNLSMAEYDQPMGYTWYEYANVDDGYNSSDVPPYEGNQSSPKRANSCAAKNDYGFDDWRLPTEQEGLEIGKQLYSLYNDAFRNYFFNFSNTYYSSNLLTASANSSNVDMVSIIYINNSSPSLNNTSKAAVNNYSYMVRCVRESGDIFDSPSGAGATVDAIPETVKLKANSKMGINTSLITQGANYDLVIDDVSIVHTATRGDGTMVYEITIKTKAGSSASKVVGEFTIHSSDGTKTHRYKITQTGNFFIPKSSFSSNYDLIVQYTDLVIGSTVRWYEANNVDNGYNTMETPPFEGNQSSPINASSCAASTVGGYTDWRIPTLAESEAIFNKFTISLTGGSTAYGFTSGYYWTSTSMMINQAYRFRMGYNSYQTSYSNKTAANYVRCVRSDNRLTFAAPIEFTIRTVGGEVRTSIRSPYSLNTTVTPGANYSSVIEDVVITPVGTNAGDYVYDMNIKYKPIATPGVSTSFTITSGGNSQVVNITRDESYLVGGNLIVAPEDQPTGSTWLVSANTTVSENTVPPAGTQSNPPLAGSCAELNTLNKYGISTGWRLPTEAELVSISTHFGGLTGGVTAYGFQSSYYRSATPRSGSPTYYMAVNLSNGNSTYANKTSSSYNTRCVRSL